MTALVWDTANQQFLTNGDGTYQQNYAFFQAYQVQAFQLDTQAGDDVVPPSSTELPAAEPVPVGAEEARA